ncbi:MAG: Lytic transglycosylase, catalytic, partial [uncultured bacterium]
MIDLKTVFKGTCPILAFVVLGAFSACGSAEKSASKTSADAISSVLEQTSAQKQVLTENYKPLTGRMDGVQFYINQELMNAGLDKEGKEFAELKSSFDQPSTKMWQPQKGFNLPVTRNQYVDRWITYFTGPIRTNFERWIRRGSQYVPIMEQILKEKGVPTDLIYLSMIESGFNAHAYSRAHAAGLWQFIPGTGRMYGLESGGVVDERRDIIKATTAAANHLKDLYAMYNDWYLAFAAYNAGPGTVNRALKGMGSANFWQISASKKHFFRQETKDYVPRILAAAIIMKNYKKYGFSSQLFDKPLAFDSVEVPDATDISTLAECSGLTEEEMKYLNPSLVSGMTPMGKPYVVHIPVGSSGSFKKNYARLAPLHRVFFVTHKVHKRETLASIAGKYKIGTKTLLSSNNLSSAKQIKVGMKLMIPRQGLAKSIGQVKEVSTVALSQPSALGSSSLSNSMAPASNDFDEPDSIDAAVSDDLEKETKKAKQALVKNTETPGIPEFTELEAPQEESVAVRYKVEAAKTYKVKAGDTLAGIAKANKTTLANLQKLNKMGTKSLVKIGQVLNITAEKKTRFEEAAPQQLALAAPAPVALEAAKESPLPVAATEPQNEENSNSQFKLYEVVAGDSLAQIAVKNGVTVALIREWNQLGTDASVNPGQQLKIGASLWQPPANILANVSTSQPKSSPVTKQLAVAIAPQP